MPRNGSTALVERPTSKEALHQLEQVVIQGDLAKLSPEERIAYYARVTESLGINPLTRPFEYISLNGRLVLYARKDATDQLRQIKGISIDRLDREQADDLAVVTAYGHDRSHRTDSSIGAVAIKGLTGEALANAIMKAETKAKRRLTLSLAGLGWLDETEVGWVEESAAVSHPIVETRRAAVAQRLAGMSSATARPAGDPWLRMIHAVGAERGLDHERIHQLAVDKLGVESLNELSAEERESFEKILRRKRATEPQTVSTGVSPDRSEQGLAAPAALPPSATEQPPVGEPGNAPQVAQPGASSPAPGSTSGDSDARAGQGAGTGTPAPTSTEEASLAFAQAAEAQGLATDWEVLDQLVRDALNREPDSLAVADWLAIRDRVAGGEFDPPVSRAQAVTG